MKVTSFCLFSQFGVENKYLKHCVIVPCESEFEVRDRAMAKVGVYDYYKPGKIKQGCSECESVRS